MAITKQQNTSKETSGANALAYPGSVGSGSALACTVYWNNLVDLNSVVDSRNGAWTPCGTRFTGAGALSTWSIQSFVMLAPAAGATTVTATPSAAVTVGLLIYEFTGFTGTPTLDGSAYLNDAASPYVSGSINTTIANAVVFASVFCENSMHPSQPGISTPFTSVAPAGGDGTWGLGGHGYEVVSSTQSGLTFSYVLQSTSDNSASSILAIGDASSHTPVTYTKVGTGTWGP